MARYKLKRMSVDEIEALDDVFEQLGRFHAMQGEEHIADLRGKVDGVLNLVRKGWAVEAALHERFEEKLRRGFKDRREFQVYGLGMGPRKTKLTPPTAVGMTG
jgi:hypothetical protein